MNALGSIEWTVEAVAALSSVALVAAFAFGLGRRSVGRVASGVSELARVASSGALVPSSARVWRPEVALAALEPSAVGEAMPAELDPAFVVSFLERLDDTLIAAHRHGELPTIAGPVARALASLAGNQRLVGALAGKAGYWVVRAPRGTKWLTAGGRPVAQAAGPAGQVGAKAVVVGGTAVALAPELAAVAAVAFAEYILTIKVERVGKIVSLVHHRQVSEALAAADQARSLVRRIRAFSNEPTDWPDALLQRLVGCYHDLERQASASDRIRDLVLGKADAATDKQPREPGTGDRGAAIAELAAGYQVHAIAAQAAALRAEHAIAHGDTVTAQVVLDDLATHVDGLLRHHDVIDGISEQRRRWFSGWGADVTALGAQYRRLVELLDAPEFQFLVAIGDAEAEAEVLALPPSRVALPPGVPALPDSARAEAEPAGLIPSGDRGRRHLEMGSTSLGVG